MKILMTAYACEPGKGSEEGIGWNWARQVALRNECVLITRENNVEAIRSACSQEGITGITVVGFDLPYWMRFWKRGARGAMAYFYLWQLAVWIPARRLNSQIGFDLVHHTTFASSWIPSGLAFVGPPFVWGPVGQHPRVPGIALRQAPWSVRVAERVKAAIKWIALHFDPFLRLTISRANRILSLGSEFEKRLPRLLGLPTQRIPACGVTSLKPGPKEGTQVLFSGRLVSLKGPTLALAAFARARVNHPGIQMSFMGEGPLRAQLEAQARELGIERAVTFLGRRSFDQALILMSTADIFLFPSFEGAGMVVPEAMASGAVVLCLDFGGPGDMVAGGRGMAVPVGTTEDETVANLAGGLEQLLGSPQLRRALRTEAQNWVRSEMLWDRKGDQLQSIYESVLREAREGKA
jgi:glycosyltransferase involved in cell wall biosynthesis